MKSSWNQSTLTPLVLGLVLFSEIPTVNVCIGVAIIALSGICTTTRKSAVQ